MRKTYTTEASFQVQPRRKSFWVISIAFKIANAGKRMFEKRNLFQFLLQTILHTSVTDYILGQLYSFRNICNFYHNIYLTLRLFHIHKAFFKYITDIYGSRVRNFKAYQILFLYICIAHILR